MNSKQTVTGIPVEHSPKPGVPTPLPKLQDLQTERGIYTFLLIIHLKKIALKVELHDVTDKILGWTKQGSAVEAHSVFF